MIITLQDSLSWWLFHFSVLCWYSTSVVNGTASVLKAADKVKSHQWLKNWYSGVWFVRCYGVSAMTGWPGVSILWLGELARLTYNFYLSVAAWKVIWADCKFDLQLLPQYDSMNSYLSRWQVWPTTSTSVWQHAELSEQRASLTYNFYLSVAACRVVWADLSLRCTAQACHSTARCITTKPPRQ